MLLSQAHQDFTRALADYTDAPEARADVEIAGKNVEIRHGAVTIAAITSCTNTSNPSVMIGAGLLAKNAVERGLTSKPWVKTTLAPGSKVVTDYYEKSGLLPYLEKLGFDIVGYGCTTCIGNSGPLIPEVSAAVNEADLAVTSVLSGNRNFEGRINPDVKMNYLNLRWWSPTRSRDRWISTSLESHWGRLRMELLSIWQISGRVRMRFRRQLTHPSTRNVHQQISGCFRGRRPLEEPPTPEGDVFAWDSASTYIRKAPYFHDLQRDPQPVANISAPASWPCWVTRSPRTHFTGRCDQGRQPSRHVP